MSGERVLIANPFGIGDVLFTMPLLRSLREALPDATLGYLCNRRVEELMRVNPCVDAVFVFEKDEYRVLWKQNKREWLRNFLKLLKEIRRRRFDTLIDFSLNWHYSFLAMLLGIRRRVGFNYRRRGKFLTDSKTVKGFDDRHMVLYYLELLEVLGIHRSESPRLEYVIPDEDRRWAKEFFDANGIPQDGIVIGMTPGGGASWGRYSSYRHWPKDHYTTLVHRLFSEGNRTLLLFGDSQDTPLCEAVAKAASGKAVVTAGKTTLRQLFALMERCHLYVGNEGGILHVAVATGVPSVTFFGPVDEKIYGPFGPPPP
ncbi:MAG: glycosyltransferase family 9 protein, partial [Candidatus Omnitrophota bacterium]